MATFAMLGGRAPPEDDYGLAGTKTRKQTKRCDGIPGGNDRRSNSASAPWERPSTPTKPTKQQLPGTPTTIRSPEHQGKRVSPALSANVMPPWNHSTRVSSRRKHVDDLRAEKTMKGGAWQPPGDHPKMRSVDYVSNERPWDKQQDKTAGRVCGDPFGNASHRNKSTDVLLHESGTNTPADAGRRVFQTPTALHDTSMTGAEENSYSHSLLSQGRASPVIRAQKIRGQSPPQSVDRMGGRVHLTARESREQKLAGRNTTHSFNGQTHSHIWGTGAAGLQQAKGGKRASTPQSRDPAPWEKPSTAPFSMPSASPRSSTPQEQSAPWEKDGSAAQRTGVSTAARDSLMMRRAWNPDVSTGGYSSVERAGRACASPASAVNSMPARSSSTGTVKHF